MNMKKNCYLILDDKTIYRGTSFGSQAPLAGELNLEQLQTVPAGEVVFNTGMSGYHEILSDPSYRGQIVVMTYPHIGNYGCEDSWSESGPAPYPGKLELNLSGFVVRNLYTGPVLAGRITLDEFLKKQGICGLAGIDTRHLTLKTRDEGSKRGVIIRAAGEEITQAELDKVHAFLRAFPLMEGRDLVTDLGIKETFLAKGNAPHFCLIDSGAKTNIFRELVNLGCRVTVVPNTYNKEQITAVKADCLLFSNGPGDPAMLKHLVNLAKDFIGRIPVCGICLGHQVISLALGAETFKMKFGHHGINNPVRDEKTGMVIVTSQNHGFAVDDKTLPPNVDVRFRNANDRTVEGIVHRKLPLYTVQFHPEAAPGPRDALWIFRDFVNLVGSE